MTKDTAKKLLDNLCELEDYIETNSKEGDPQEFLGLSEDFVNTAISDIKTVLRAVTLTIKE